MVFCCAQADSRQAVMHDAIKTWVDSWTSGQDLSTLDKILSNDVAIWDCYGLHGSSATAKRGQEGVQLVVSNRGEAKAAIQHLHDTYRNQNNLLSWAVNEDMKVRHSRIAGSFADGCTISLALWVALSRLVITELGSAVTLD